MIKKSTSEKGKCNVALLLGPYVLVLIKKNTKTTSNIQHVIKKQIYCWISVYTEIHIISDFKINANNLVDPYICYGAKAYANLSKR